MKLMGVCLVYQDSLKSQGKPLKVPIYASLKVWRPFDSVRLKFRALVPITHDN